MSLLATCGAVIYAALGAGWDIRARRIPNGLSAAALVAALVVAATPAGLGVSTACLGALLGLAVFLAPYSLGAVGGGDVKFAAVASAWLGPRLGLQALLLGTALGLVVALACASGEGRLRDAIAGARRTVWLLAATLRLSTLPPAPPPLGRLATIPYAVPLAGGVLLTVACAHHGWVLL